MKFSPIVSLLYLLFSHSSCKDNSSNKQIVPVLTAPEIELETVFTDRSIIWGFDFLSEDELVFTEKTGKISIYKNGKIIELSGVPAGIDASGQGGLLDICLHPDYKKNGWIYTCHTSLENGSGKLNLVRFKINGNNIEQMQTIFQTTNGNTWKGHYGSRIVFDNDGLLYLSVGEGGTGSYGGVNTINKNAEDVNSPWGKIHRMTDEGKVPGDNPVLNGQSTATTVYSYGHRNPQGLALKKETNQIFETEHGPKGGDEFNLIKKGLNYGWPLVSHGVNYDGKKVSDSPLMDGVEPVLHYWTPSTGTCGLAYISTNTYGSWKGSFLAGGLALKNVSRVELTSGNETNVSLVLENIGRVRNVKESPEGYIYISVENPGRILKLKPVF